MHSTCGDYKNPFDEEISRNFRRGLFFHGGMEISKDDSAPDYFPDIVDNFSRKHIGFYF